MKIAPESAALMELPEVTVHGRVPWWIRSVVPYGALLFVLLVAAKRHG